MDGWCVSASSNNKHCGRASWGGERSGEGPRLVLNLNNTRGDKCLLYCLSNESLLSSITLHTHTHIHCHSCTRTHASSCDEGPAALLKTQQPYFLPKKRLQSRHCLLSDRAACRLVFVLCPPPSPPFWCEHTTVQRCNLALGHKAASSATCAGALLQKGQLTVGQCGKGLWQKTSGFCDTQRVPLL